MITINQPITLTNNQTWTVSTITQWNNQGVWSAKVVYNKLGDNGQVIDSVALDYTGTDYNTWWDNYNNGAFLIQNLITHLSLNVSIPPNIEDEFEN